MSIEKVRWVLPLISMAAGVGLAAGGVSAYPHPSARWLALGAACLGGVGFFFLFLVVAEVATGGHKERRDETTAQEPDKAGGKRAT
ncbi:MAG: hypothetical protein DYG94_12780 [Leptolyngbya sp. PLA3]|nr:MAG: hypothetical protein EDM82_12370 [Cyanobacteria bacterium CYA]MCE7969600.1 hypothetical protein [Leptolyngbya sp. PL-A3]